MNLLGDLRYVHPGDTATFVEAVFDALAAGTFLYVATLDIIAEVYEEAGVGPEDVDVVELHDCFTANEPV